MGLSSLTWCSLTDHLSSNLQQNPACLKRLAREGASKAHLVPQHLILCFALRLRGQCIA